MPCVLMPTGLPGAAPGLGTLCQLTVRLLAGPVPLHIPAWQWWHLRTSTLVQVDIGGICQTVSLLSYLHHYQAGSRSVCLSYFTLWRKHEETTGGVTMLGNQATGLVANGYGTTMDVLPA